MSTAGPGRMVQDASFFASVLRQRINEISGEITRMRGEVDKSAKDATVLNQYEKKYESLIKEVRALEGDLADYNLAMDKSRTSMVRSLHSGDAPLSVAAVCVVCCDDSPIRTATDTPHTHTQLFASV